MSRKIRVDKITLNYKCEKCEETAQQYLCDIVEVGTAICPECGEDMNLDDFATEDDCNAVESMKQAIITTIAVFSLKNPAYNIIERDAIKKLIATLNAFQEESTQ